ncbi:MAG: EF-hand domain-containing protein [Defluviicoccus sp.]|nr:EF-hand domain-containing protein [Defluviicoccus sp.]
MAALSKTLGVASIAALLAFGANAALAQTPTANNDRETSAAGQETRKGTGWRAARFLRLYDTDGSGDVSLAEIQAEQKRIAGAADVDGDGVLSVDEFRRRGRLIRSLGATSLFDMLDTDGDAKVTQAEIEAPSARWFKRYDANGDGTVAADELPRRGPPAGWRRGHRR